jgi:hypothetical protein
MLRSAMHELEDLLCQTTRDADFSSVSNIGVLGVTELCPISAQGCASSLRHNVVQ